MQDTKILASPIQAVHWRLTRGARPSRPVCAYICVIVNSELQGEGLRSAVERLAEQNEVLRTGYEVDAYGVLWQSVHAQVALDVEELDWRSIPATALESLKATVRARDATRDCRQPWLSLTVARLDSARTWLQLAAPSMSVDASTLVRVIDGMLRPCVGSEPVIQYSEVSAWLTDFVLNDELREARELWHTPRLSQAFRPEIGLQRYFPAGTATHPDRRIDLGARIDELREFAELHGATVADVICASLRMELRRIGPEACLCRVVDSRTDEALREALGPMSRVVPILPPPAEALADASRAEVGALESARDFLECFTRPVAHDTDSFPFTFSASSCPDAAGRYHIETLLAPLEVSRIEFHLLEQGGDTALLVHFDADFIDADALDEWLARWANGLTLQLAGARREPRRFTIDGSRCDPAGAHTNVVDWFSSAARGAGGQIIDAEGNLLTSEELNRRANRLARYLIEAGVGRGGIVALHLPRSIEYLVAMLAVLKAGAAYVPVDIELPKARVEAMLRDARPCLTITGATLEGIEAVSLRDIAYGHFAADDPGIRIEPTDLAYILYTSGTSGRPKGVRIPHGALHNHMWWMQAEFAYRADDVFLQRTSLSFDASVWEIWSPLLARATLILPPGDINYDLSAMTALLRKHQVTVLQLVPSLLEACMDHGGLLDIRSLRYLFCGGEALKTSSAEKAARALHCEVINLYGPTECCIDSTFFRYREQLRTDYVPIGKPVSNVSCIVLTPDGEEAGRGEAGELCITGPCLFQGYHAQEELTQSALVQRPPHPGSFYRTGDHVRVLHDDNLYYLERIDDQIKLNGYRIELSEISRLLEQRRPGAQGAAIYDKELRSIDLFVRGVSPSDAAATLHAELPAYMLPAQVIALDDFPRTANGKLDVRTLLARAREQAANAYRAPGNPIEAALADIWGEALGITQPISTASNFFALGGHSLLAMKVVARVCEHFNVAMTVRALFENRTISSLAAHIASLEKTGFVRIDRAARGDTAPLSFGQQRLWFIDQMDGASTQYNMPVALRLTGHLQRQHVAEAINGIVARHEILRTTYSMVNAVAVQRVHDAKQVPITQADLSHLDPAAQELELRQLALQEAATPFDLSRDLMLRIRLIRLAADSHVVLFTMHHIASDGWSLGVLAREFMALYEARRTQQASPLAPLPIQYADYAIWQVSTFTQQRLESQIEYWRQQLQGIPVVHSLPTDRPRPPQQQFAGSNVLQQLDAGLLQRLKSLAAHHDTTLFVVLQSAFALLLSRWSNERDIVIGSPVAGRHRRETESLIGFFVNTLVFRFHFPADLTCNGLIERARRDALDAQANQEIPFEWLVNELQPQRSLAHSPIFQVLFNLQNNEQVAMQLPELAVAALSGTESVAKFDLEVSATETAGELWMNWTYATSLFDEATVRRLSESFVLLLQGILQDPDRSVLEVPIITERDEKLLQQWRGPNDPYPADQCVHELFEEHAAATPDALAVSWRDRSLTYAQLNEKANRVAHLLIERGVGPESLVGICVERSLDMIVGMLGVVKAGGAFVPLDRSYPASRLRFMLEDSGAALVLTHADIARELLLGPDRNISLDDEESFGRHSSANPRVPGLTPDNLIYVTYTSGSTGNPKGVQVVHRGITRLVHRPQYVPLDSTTCMLQTCAFAFDVSNFEIWGALANGGRLVLYPETKIDTNELTSLIRSAGVNTLWLTSALFDTWVAQLTDDDQIAARYILVGGDVVSPHSVRRVYELSDTVQLINGYGPTENSVFSVCHQITREDGHKASIPIGRPVNQTQAYVLDANGRRVPIGVAGELHVGGVGVARGYKNREELTTERFIQSPFAADGAGRLYRTGDLVRFLDDGCLQFLGRLDEQVKVRGFRIEPGEIVAQLLRNSSVADALVMTDGAGNEKRLIAYVVAVHGIPDNIPGYVDGLRQQLRQTLPEFMIPAAFGVLASFPVNPNGKVDRARLPAIDAALQSETAFIEPRGPTEVTLAAIWGRTLNLPAVSAAMNFFQVGGNSLNLTRVQAEVRKSYGLNIPLKALFAHNTIRQQAELIDGFLLVANDAAEATGVAQIEEVL